MQRVGRRRRPARRVDALARTTGIDGQQATAAERQTSAKRERSDHAIDLSAGGCSQIRGQEVATSRERRTSSGASRFDRCPASGSTTRRDRADADSASLPASAGGVSTSSSPTTTSAGQRDARRGRASNRAGPSSPRSRRRCLDALASIICAHLWRRARTPRAAIVAPSSFGSIWSATPAAPRARASSIICRRPSRPSGVSACAFVSARIIPLKRSGAAGTAQT